jgi:hypothetical protein
MEKPRTSERRTNMNLKYFIYFLGVLSLCSGRGARAQTRSQVYGDKLTKQAQTFYIRASSGMTSFDSQTADSKETRNTTAYELGGWLGESRIVGIRVATRQDKIPFQLNSSVSEQNFTDVRVAGRLSFLTPSIGVSTSEVNVNKPEGNKVGIIATGLSAGLGAHLVVHDSIVANFDFMAVRSNRVYDKLAQNTRLGDRQEMDGNIAFDLTDRMVDLLVGYNMRSFLLKTSEENYVEKAQGAYVGLRLGVYF